MNSHTPVQPLVSGHEAHPPHDHETGGDACTGSACGDCHGHDAPATDARFRRALWAALVLNAAMFVIEVGGGLKADSSALLADAVDFAGDTLSYALSLLALGWAATTRSRVAEFKGWTMTVYGVGVLAHAAWGLWLGKTPEAATMGVVGGLALVVNAGVAWLLYRHRDLDANAHSVWVCSRNDAIGNLAILAAAMGVLGTGSVLPDTAVAGVMAVLAIQGGVQVLRRARAERQALVTSRPERLPAAHTHGAR